MNEHKWLPSEPTIEMLGAFGDTYLVLSGHDVCKTHRINSFREAYRAMLNAAPVAEQEPVAYLVTIERYDRLDARLVYKLNDLVLNEATKIVNYEPLYTHPQADQTALINQLTDELNKTEAERVKWMTVALTSQLSTT
jgi:hypothetical protein